MTSPHRRVFSAALICLSAMTPLAAPAQPSSTVRNIKQFPQQFVNLEVTIVGQATSVEVSRSGLAQGTYRLVDDSDSQGILVRTNNELPIPGRVYTVTGAVSQLQENIATIGLVEHSRTGERSPWLLAVVVISGLAAVVLAIFRVRAIRQPAPQPVPPLPIYAPAPQPLPPLPSPVVVPSADTRTKPMPRTQPFELSGASVRIVEGPNRDTEMPIGVPEFLIGRNGGRENHLTVSDPTVSMVHARIRWDKSNNSFFLINESQTNKVRLDGAPTEMSELQNGSRIQVGAVTLEFRKQAVNGNGSHG